MERHLPGPVHGHGNDGRHLTLRSLLSHTSGLSPYTAATTVPVPLTPLQKPSAPPSPLRNRPQHPFLLRNPQHPSLLKGRPQHPSPRRGRPHHPRPLPPWTAPPGGSTQVPRDPS
ncbi:hypothetical protein ACGFRG_27955 [Streptomyces sp. NPDC048696]|uniref:hypothetical protein n=1 Tax=Streptomyces sp. NPDC048696 TaxID=3365585 RepID=UPI003718929A